MELEDDYDPIALGEQDEWGTDLLAIRENLRLTPTERVRKHALALRSLYLLQNARRIPRPSQDASDPERP